MNNIYSTRQNLIDIWSVISSRRKIQSFLLLILMLLSSLSEMFTLAASVPFLSTIVNPQEFLTRKNIYSSIKVFGINTETEIIIFITLIFAFLALLTSGIRLTNLWLNTKYAALIGSDLSCKLFEKTIKQNYEFHLNNNSSKTLSLSTKFISNIVGSINQILQFISSFLIVSSITIGLILIDWQIAFSAIFIFSFSYLLVVYFSKKTLNRNSKIMARNSEIQVKSLQEGLGAIKDLILYNSYDMYLKKYKDADLPIRTKEAENNFISLFPRYFIEAIGMVLIAILALILTLNNETNKEVIPILGSLALGAQRLLPALQQMYSGWASINGNASGIKETLNIIKREVPYESQLISKSKLKILNLISLENIKYKFPNTKDYVINNLSLTINKGEKVGIIGKTGSGKSTLLNILMGLITPEHGTIYIDKKVIDNKKNAINLINWRKEIAYVPQDIYLSDSSIKENIAFGIPSENIDLSEVKNAARKANIYEFIMNSKYKFDTHVGERGIKLSGGQKQRIGIARALYKNSKILILDEATSALDNNTESKIMQLIDNLDSKLTIIIVAHRLSTLGNCDKIIEIKNGRVNNILKPQELM
tara:strand:- start:1954 stop:3729 length:1776 start_codon:yes stop_codon:yes gene_type:complete